MKASGSVRLQCRGYHPVHELDVGNHVEVGLECRLVLEQPLETDLDRDAAVDRDRECVQRVQGVVRRVGEIDVRPEIAVERRRWIEVLGIIPPGSSAAKPPIFPDRAPLLRGRYS